MSVCYAVSHIGIGGRRYTPGERLPELDDAQWERLMKLGAIRTEFPSQEDAGHDAPAKLAKDAQTGETHSGGADGTGEDDAGDEDDGEDDAGDETDMPEVDATDGIVEDEPEEAPAPRKRTRKTA